MCSKVGTLVAINVNQTCLVIILVRLRGQRFIVSPSLCLNIISRTNSKIKHSIELLMKALKYNSLHVRHAHLTWMCVLDYHHTVIRYPFIWCGKALILVQPVTFNWSLYQWRVHWAITRIYWRYYEWLYSLDTARERSLHRTHLNKNLLWLGMNNKNSCRYNRGRVSKGPNAPVI